MVDQPSGEGEGPNIAPMCRLTTSPTVASPLPVCHRCTGAMVIIATITRFTSASSPRAAPVVRGAEPAGAPGGPAAVEDRDG